MAGRRRGRYSREYKERMVELVRAGRTLGSLARAFDPSEQTMRNWVRPADLDGGLRSHGLTDPPAGPHLAEGLVRRTDPTPEELRALEALKGQVEERRIAGPPVMAAVPAAAAEV